MIVGNGSKQCVVLASVGPAWSRATLPESLYDVLTFHLIQPSRGESSVAAVTQQLSDAARILDQPLVSGISMNGTLALTAAAAHPDIFSGVLAVTAPPRLPPDPKAVTAYAHAVEPERQEEFDRRKTEAKRADEGSEEEARLWRRVDAVRRWHDWAFDATALDSLAVMDREWVSSIMADGEHHDWEDIISAVVCPALLILGRSDFVVPPMSWALDDLPENFAVEVFDRSGHTPPYEQPDEFDATVRGWLGRATT